MLQNFKLDLKNLRRNLQNRGHKFVNLLVEIKLLQFLFPVTVDTNLNISKIQK